MYTIYVSWSYDYWYRDDNYDYAIQEFFLSGKESNGSPVALFLDGELIAVYCRF